MIRRICSFDENPMPKAENVAGSEVAVLWIGADKVTAAWIARLGSKLCGKIQPFFYAPDKQPRLVYDWDKISWDIVNRHNAVLLNRSGDWAMLAENGQGLDGYYAWDFSNLDFAEEMGTALLDYAASVGFQSIMWDYGCGDLSFVYPLRPAIVDPAIWPKWAQGYALYRSMVKARMPAIAACNTWVPPMSDCASALVLEAISATGSDTGYPPSYKEALTLFQNPCGRDNILLIQNSTPRNRRMICGVGMITDSLVNYRPTFFGGDRSLNSIPMEYGKLNLGWPKYPAILKAPDVWRRDYQWGFVVLNLGFTPYVISPKKSVAAKDALVAQTYDTTTYTRLPEQKWLTNENV